MPAGRESGGHIQLLYRLDNSKVESAKQLAIQMMAVLHMFRDELFNGHQPHANPVDVAKSSCRATQWRPRRLAAHFSHQFLQTDALLSTKIFVPPSVMKGASFLHPAPQLDEIRNI